MANRKPAPACCLVVNRSPVVNGSPALPAGAGPSSGSSWIAAARAAIRASRRRRSSRERFHATVLVTRDEGGGLVLLPGTYGTGIALQDSATVPLEYERAMAAGVGIEKKMIST